MDLIKIIDEAIITKIPKEECSYIGASSIGEDCLRKLWYRFNNIPGAEFTAKQLRIFDIGKKLEEMVKDYMELAGFKLIRPNKENNFLFCQDETYPIFQGHSDALLHINDTNISVLEIKTANHNEYKKFVDLGVKAWEQTYYYQMIAYMGMFKLKNAVIIVINKDDSSWSAEWVEYDDIVYCELKTKASLISTMEKEPSRINDNPCYWVCQMCKYKITCHSGVKNA